MSVITIGQSCPSCHHEATSHGILGCVIEGCRCARTNRAMSNITQHIADIVIARFRAEPNTETSAHASPSPSRAARHVAEMAYIRGRRDGIGNNGVCVGFDHWWDETGSKL